MARINNVWYGEFYSPVSSSNEETREEFYAYAAEAIEAMQQKDPEIPIIILGDFNAHIREHYSNTTDGNGKLLLNIMKQQRLELLNMNSPTFEQPGKNLT